MLLIQFCLGDTLKLFKQVARAGLKMDFLEEKHYMSLFEEREQRIASAIAFEPVDMIPVVYGSSAFSATACDVALGDFVANMELNCTCHIKTSELCGFDGVQSRTLSPYVLPGMWLSKVKVPGEELSNNELWQVIESELVTQEDYEAILDGDFENWLNSFILEKLGNPGQHLKDFFAYGPTAKKRFDEAQIPCIKGGVLVDPFEMFCGGRSLATFFVEDLMEIPETVEAVFEKVHAYNMAKYERQFSSPAKPNGVWVGGWRGTPGMLSKEWFMKYSWKYKRDLINLCLDYDVLPILHLDSSWDNNLDVIKEFPAKRCLVALDGATDIKHAKEVLGDHSCIMGDVPARLLAYGSAQENYDYVTNLLKIMGPTGFIICSGCDVPFNAKLENVQMMAKARDDYFKKS